MVLSCSQHNWVEIEDLDFSKVAFYPTYFMFVLLLQPSEFRENSPNLKAMEQLGLNNGNGQSYGYIVYRKRLPINQGSILSMRGRPRDLLHVSTVTQF